MRGARNALGHRRLGIGLALLSMALASPALFSGTQLDDDFHRAVVLGFPGPLGPAATDQGMFAFIDGNLARTQLFRDVGVLPWWTPPHARGAFWRPVSELTHRLDYRLWPELPALMHLQSLLWFAAAVLVATVWYRRILGATWVAGLAAFLWAVDGGHGMAIGWIANRNALVAIFFGLVTLLVHHRWRADGWRLGALVGPCCFAAALLSSEGALETTAYLFAYALFLDRGRLAKRLAALVPYAALVVVWRVAYQRLGYGASSSGVYIDPVRDPARFLIAAARRAPILLEGLLGPIPSDLDILLPRAAHVWFVALAAIFGVGVLALILRALRRDDIARFFLVGSALSLVPACATFCADRLLFFAGVGGMGLVARFVGVVADGALVPGPRWSRALAVALIGIHAVLAPLELPFRTLSVAAIARFAFGCIEQMPDDPAIAGQTAILVNAAEFCAAYIPLRRGFEGRRMPAKMRTLANSTTPVTARREDERTLALQREVGFFSREGEQMLRDPAIPWFVGERIELSGVSIEVRALTRDGFPSDIAYHFAVPLEDPSLRWFELRDRKLRPFRLPLVGAPAVTVAPSVSL